MHINMQQLPLSVREQQISILCAQGYSNREIADEVSVSENTVKFHLKQIFKKLDVRKRAELMFIFYKKLPERVGDLNQQAGIMESSGNGVGRSLNKEFEVEDMIENNQMRELSVYEIEEVNGGDAWDVAEGALSGAGAGATAVGVAIAVGAVVTAPIGLGVVGGGALAGAAWEYFFS